MKKDEIVDGLLEKNVAFRDRRESLENYYFWRIKIAEEQVKYLKRFVSFKGKRVLDVGCGTAATSLSLAHEGGEVVSFDITFNNMWKTRPELRLLGVRFLIVDAHNLPFRDGCFDMIFASDVMEHVSDPCLVVQELERVAKPNGQLYFKFLPYYGLGGHHLYDYTLIPVQFLPQKIVKKIICRKKGSGLRDPQKDFQVFKALNKITVGRFGKMTRNLEKVDEKFGASARVLSKPLFRSIITHLIKSKIPIICDLFVSKYQGLFRLTQRKGSIDD